MTAPLTDASASLAGMTTAASPSVAWIRLTVEGGDLLLAPSPGVELRLTEYRVDSGGRLNPLAPARPLGFSMTVDLVPLDGSSVLRCERHARDVAAWLGVGCLSPGEFSMEVAVDGEDLPYNRMEVPRLYLASGEPPAFDYDQPLPSVRVFTARVPAGVGTAYTLRRV